MLLNGVVDTISISEVNGLKKLSVSVVSHSVYMDVKKHIRVFQDGRVSFKDVVSLLENESDNCSFIIPTGGDTAIERMLVQYKETDWEFAKRLASRLNTVIFPDCKLGKPYVSIGLTRTAGVTAIQPIEYSMRKEMAEFAAVNNSGVEDFLERDAIYYEVTTREIHDLCEPIRFKELNTFVYAVETELVGSTLLHKYTLKEKSGFRCAEFFNTDLIGVSLMGSVAKIKRDQVQVTTDDETKEKSYCWLAFSTIYSSPDNTGWYFMPEEGDSVRLQFPNEHEEMAYVISAAHQGQHDDADIKSIRTKHGKSVVFEPESITISNGSSTIRLDDKQGLQFSSSQDINISAAGDINFDSKGKIVVSGGKGVKLQQTDNSIVVDKNIDITAGKVRIR